MDWKTVYDFWFTELSADQWFALSPELDKKITERFSDLLLKAAAGELSHWRHSAQGALCEVIVLDQFSRNIYRATPQAFAQDPQALTLAQFAIEKGLDKQLSTTEVGFLYLPFMHSESIEIHKKAMALFKGHPSYEFEVAHKEIIEKFGRYPHRNAILARTSSADELTFLTQPNSSF